MKHFTKTLTNKILNILSNIFQKEPSQQVCAKMWRIGVIWQILKISQKKSLKNKCKIMWQICVILKILKISRDRIYLPDRRVSRAFFLSSSSGYRGISWEVCKELYFSKSFAIFRCTSISRTGSGKGRTEMYWFFMPFSVSAPKKIRSAGIQTILKRPDVPMAKHKFLLIFFKEHIKMGTTFKMWSQTTQFRGQRANTKYSCTYIR